MSALARVCGARSSPAAALAVAAPAGGANECDGLQVCVPVAGPWVVVPGVDGRAAPRVEYQLTCPRGHVVGGLDARLSVRGIDVELPRHAREPGQSRDHDVALGGVRRRRTSGSRTGRRRFQPFIGCMPAAGGGSRVPTSVTAVPPGQPVTRRVKTVRVRPGTTTVVQRCAAGERLVGGSHAFGFATRTPPSASLVSSVSGSQPIGGRERRRPRSR